MNGEHYLPNVLRFQACILFLSVNESFDLRTCVRSPPGVFSRSRFAGPNAPAIFWKAAFERRSRKSYGMQLRRGSCQDSIGRSRSIPRVYRISDLVKHVYSHPNVHILRPLAVRIITAGFLKAVDYRQWQTTYLNMPKCKTNVREEETLTGHSLKILVSLLP